MNKILYCTIITPILLKLKKINNRYKYCELLSSERNRYGRHRSTIGHRAIGWYRRLVLVGSEYRLTVVSPCLSAAGLRCCFLPCFPNWLWIIFWSPSGCGLGGFVSCYSCSGYISLQLNTICRETNVSFYLLR